MYIYQYIYIPDVFMYSVYMYIHTCIHIHIRAQMYIRYTRNMPREGEGEKEGERCNKEFGTTMRERAKEKEKRGERRLRFHDCVYTRK